MSELAKAQNEAQQLPPLLRVQAGRVGVPLVLHLALHVPAWLLLHGQRNSQAVSALHDTCERIPSEALTNGTSLSAPCPTLPAPAWEESSCVTEMAQVMLCS